MRSSGSLEYKDKLITAIKSTIHLKCKEAATLGATVGSFYLCGTNLKIINLSRKFVLLLSIEYSGHNGIKFLEP